MGVYDCIIIGGGPAGMAAQIYAGRAEIKTLRIEKGFPGGQVLNTYEVDNYPGLPMLDGMTLAGKMAEHSQKYGVQEVMDEVLRIEDADQTIKKVVTSNQTYETRTIVMATGCRHRLLGAPGESKFSGHGVSYCATCDGGFFRQKDVLVVGGGDVAVEDAIYLTKMCRKVYLAHRRDTLRAAGILARSAMENEKLEILWNTEVEEIKGTQTVESVVLINNQTQERTELAMDGVFVAVGMDPNTELLQDIAELQHGFVVCDEYMQTSVKGIFAAGDLRVKPLRQVVTAVADGAIAITGVNQYLAEQDVL